VATRRTAYASLIDKGVSAVNPIFKIKYARTKIRVRGGTSEATLSARQAFSIGHTGVAVLLPTDVDGALTMLVTAARVLSRLFGGIVRANGHGVAIC
jgi:hypothetical protein